LLYPALELGAAAVVLWAMTVMRGELLLITTLLGWVLLALAAMDWRAFILADVLTLPLIAVGLIVVWWIDPNAAVWHVVGAVAGFVLMVGAASGYRWLRGRDGLGFGDAKLMAAAGAWVGLAGVGSVLLYGAVLSLCLALAGRVFGGEVSAQTPVPFGVGLAAGLWLTWLYGPLVLAA
jgi:leader peptidase (prepilin peptidase)/N-methyltransferase